MDKKSQLDKLNRLINMNSDPPTEFPKTQRLNRPITYRECCIDYVKKTMRCVGYRDYLIAELEKLEQIEQIIKRTEGTLGLDNYTVQQIKEVLNG